MNPLTHPRFSRRSLLCGLGATALLSRLGRMNALAQSSPDYKALVCIFLVGGNDGHNTIVPLTQAEFDAYHAGRGNMALPDNNGALLPVETPSGTPFGLNPGLAALHPLWAQGHLAVLANTGMLVGPINRQQFLNNLAPVPTNLFSHSDQIQQMQSGYPSTSGGTGWGARAADALHALNGSSTFPASISTNGQSLFCTGKIVQSASLLPGFDLDVSGLNLWPQSAAQARLTGLQQLLEFDSGLALIQSANQVRKDALELNALLRGNTATVNTVFPGTSLGNQLKQVAKIIALRQSTGMSRQVFFCSLGGFDTHGSQSWQHWDLLRQVSEAVAAFYQSTQELGVADRVTSFTLSDFGRSLQPSGSGTDHGWGNHHLIIGGAVQGGDVYGTFPNLALQGPDDCGSRGVLIPTTSTEQYGATLAKWLGVSEADLPTIFPNLGNFGALALSDLGFMG
ncbi:MAG: DUF1501 domain-containing protein [Verrucomicrobia bacterium]|nr:DUF1501 domain-containing protein [Verrucomicrobiota bacterium]